MLHYDGIAAVLNSEVRECNVDKIMFGYCSGPYKLCWTPLQEIEGNAWGRKCFSRFAGKTAVNAALTTDD